MDRQLNSIEGVLDVHEQSIHSLSAPISVQIGRLNADGSVFEQVYIMYTIIMYV